MTQEQQALCKVIDQRNADQAAVHAAQVHYDMLDVRVLVWTGNMILSKRKVRLQVLEQPDSRPAACHMS